MTHEPMTMERFRALVEAYGASPAHWPALERAAAEAFLAQNEEARRLCDAEAWLDQLLDTLAVPERAVSADLKARLLPPERVSADGAWHSRWLSALWPGASRAWPAGVLAASTALGILIGVALPSVDAAGGELNAGDVMSFAFSALDASEWL